MVAAKYVNPQNLGRKPYDGLKKVCRIGLYRFAQGGAMMRARIQGNFYPPTARPVSRAENKFGGD